MSTNLLTWPWSRKQQQLRLSARNPTARPLSVMNILFMMEFTNSCSTSCEFPLRLSRLRRDRRQNLQSKLKTHNSSLASFVKHNFFNLVAATQKLLNLSARHWDWPSEPSGALLVPLGHKEEEQCMMHISRSWVELTWGAEMDYAASSTMCARECLLAWLAAKRPFQKGLLIRKSLPFFSRPQSSRHK